MNRLYAVLQVGLSVVLYLVSLAIVVNMVLLAFRPETISVVNAFIGLIVMLIGCLAFARIMMKKGLASYRSYRESGESIDDNTDQNSTID